MFEGTLNWANSLTEAIYLCGRDVGAAIDLGKLEYRTRERGHTYARDPGDGDGFLLTMKRPQ